MLSYDYFFIMEELGIKNKTQIETWWRWYRTFGQKQLSIFNDGFVRW